MDNLKVAELVFVNDQLQASLIESIMAEPGEGVFGVEELAWTINMIARRHDLVIDLIDDALKKDGD